jgi:uncharacterized protein YoxC
MNHHHDFNFYYGKHPHLTNDQRAASLIEMQKQIQQLLTTRNDLIDKKDKIGSDFQINTDFYTNIDYQTAYTMDELADVIQGITPASVQGQEYSQSTYKR